MRFSASGRNIVQKKLQRHSFKVHMNNKQLFFLLKLETSFRQSYFHTTTRDSLHITSCLWSRILTRHARQIFRTSVLASNSILLLKLLTSDAFFFFKGWNPPLPPPPPLKTRPETLTFDTRSVVAT